jgi:hypothetical protein
MRPGRVEFRHGGPEETVQRPENLQRILECPSVTGYICLKKLIYEQIARPGHPAEPGARLLGRDFLDLQAGFDEIAVGEFPVDGLAATKVFQPLERNPRALGHHGRHRAVAGSPA